MGSFLDRPQSVALRRALFQIHLWLGVIAGLYLSLICLTGAALVFRIDMQRALYPDLFEASSVIKPVDAARVLDVLRFAYPQERILGVDAPTTSRPTYLAYVSEGSNLRTVLLSAANAKMLGELPRQSAIHTLQELHFNLLAGRTGTLVNGIGALCLSMLCLTGAVIWWQGRGRWRRGLQVSFNNPWPKVIWDLHSATGIWTFLIIAMWAVTALSFTFPKQFRATVNALSPVLVRPKPQSDPAHSSRDASQPSLASMLARAQALMPGQYVSRVVLPSKETDAVEVLFADQQPTPAGQQEFDGVFLDRYTGAPLKQSPRIRTTGDFIMQWSGPLHVGNFGGWAIKLLWLLLALAPPLLFVTGAIGWWRRVVRPWYQT